MVLPQFTIKKVLILVTLLAVPGFLYWMLTEKGKNRYKNLPFFGPKIVASTFHTKRGKQIPDTLYHAVANFSLKNQKGQTFAFPADSHRITVVNFFYTRSTTFSETMNRQVQQLARKFERNALVQFVSITVDPTFDTPEVLTAYQQSKGFAAKHWSFLTGPAADIQQLAKTSFLLDVLPDPNNAANIIHPSMLILLDPQKRIRGYYDVLSKEQTDKLSDEIIVLINEELRTRKDR